MFSLNQMLNVSLNLQIIIDLENWSGSPYFFSDVEKREFLSHWLDFSLQSTEFYSCLQFEVRKRLAF